MGELIAVTVVVLVIALVVFLDIRRSRGSELDRKRFTREMQGRREQRLAEQRQREAQLHPGEFFCTSCGAVCSAQVAEHIGAIAATFDAALEPGTPRIVVCDECYEKIMGGDSPQLIDHKGKV